MVLRKQMDLDSNSSFVVYRSSFPLCRAERGYPCELLPKGTVEAPGIGPQKKLEHQIEVSCCSLVCHSSGLCASYPGHVGSREPLVWSFSVTLSKEGVWQFSFYYWLRSSNSEQNFKPAWVTLRCSSALLFPKVFLFSCEIDFFFGVNLVITKWSSPTLRMPWEIKFICYISTLLIPLTSKATGVRAVQLQGIFQNL